MNDVSLVTSSAIHGGAYVAGTKTSVAGKTGTAAAGHGWPGIGVST